MTRRSRGTGGVYRVPGSRYWQIKYTSGGKTYTESSESERKKDAQDLVASRLRDVGRGIAVTPQMGKLTLGDGLKAVINDLHANGRDSVICYRCKIPCCGVEGHTNSIQRQIDRHILAHFKPERRMNSISTNDITAYVSLRLRQGAAAATVNLELATVRRAFRLAVRASELAAMPHVPMLTLNNARQGFFEKHELEAVLAHLPDWAKPPVRFAYATGWRMQSEVLPLTVSQVDLGAGIIRLEVGSTKNDRGRTISVTQEMRTLLKKQLAALDALRKGGNICPFIFHKLGGVPIKTLREAWERATKEAGYPGKYMHDFRRTGVRNLVRAGVSEHTAMKITGHKTRSIFDRYDIVNEGDLREAAAKMDVWGVEQKAKAKAAQKGQVRQFKKQRTA